MLILPGDKDVLIVDDQRRSNIAETLAGIRQESDKPIRFVIDRLRPIAAADDEEDRFVEAVYDSYVHEDLHHRL